MAPGTLLAGKYRLKALLGEGGMGSVWRAEQLTLGADVAVKLMHARAGLDAELRARFDAEAKTAATLRSPHVVQVFDFGVDAETSAPFIAMELLEGESLRERLGRGPLGPMDLLRVLTHVGRALTKAHEQHVVHRDLKPANIFLVRNADTELAKVLDFGIAKRDAALPLHGPTATGMLLGTPHYMSPEQIRSSKGVDYRTDLWSLAVIAVECLTGRLPFDADNIAGLALMISEGRATLPSALGRVPPGFDAWFQRATRHERSERFQSASELVNALREVCEAPRATAKASLEHSRREERPLLEEAPTLDAPLTVPLAPPAAVSARANFGTGTFGAATASLPTTPLLERARVRLGLALLATLALLVALTWVAGRPDEVQPTEAGNAREPAMVPAAPPSTLAIPPSPPAEPPSTPVTPAAPPAAPAPAAPAPAAPAPAAQPAAPAPNSAPPKIAPLLKEPAPKTVPSNPASSTKTPPTKTSPTKTASPKTPPTQTVEQAEPPDPWDKF